MAGKSKSKKNTASSKAKNRSKAKKTNKYLDLLMKYDYIVLTVVLILIFSPQFWHFNEIKYAGNFYHTSGDAFLNQATTVENHEFPIWFPHIKAGWPLGNMGSHMMNPIAMLFTFFMKPIPAHNLTMLLHLALLFPGMFLFFRKILKDRQSAFIAMACGSTTVVILRSFDHTYWLYGFMYLPWVLLFLYKAIHENNMVRDSIIIGSLLSLNFLTGGVMHMYYYSFFLIIYFLYEALPAIFKVKNRSVKLKPGELKKFLQIGIIMTLVFICLSAPFLFYMFEWMDYTNRGDGYTVEQAFSMRMKGDNWFNALVLGTGQPEPNFNLLSNLVFLVGVYFTFKRKWKFGYVLVGSYVMYMLIAFAVFPDTLIKLPGMDSVRMIHRITIMNVFVGSMLAGYGFKSIKLKKKELIGYALAAVLVIAAAVLYHGDIYGEYNGFLTEPSTIYDSGWATTLAADDDIFRYHIVEVTGVDYHFTNFEQYVFGLESLYGITSTFWDPRFFHGFLGLTIRDPPRLMGMMNVKYFLSAQPLNVSGMALHETFDVGKSNINPKYEEGATAYIYMNEKFLPRAFHTGKAMLVIGDSEMASQISLFVMSDPNYDPRDYIIIHREAEAIDDVPTADMAKFDYIILANNGLRDRPGMDKAIKFAEEGGVLVPDLRYTNQLGTDMLTGIIMNISNEPPEFQPAEITTYYHDNPNTMIIDTQGKEGWLFLSEKYTLYNGWKAVDSDGNSLRIEKANGVLSAVWLDGDEDYVRFDFAPKRYIIGKYLQRLALLVLLGLLVFHIWRRKK
ncbi:hypothetical protein ACFL1B_02505 [Nanoarchaeota archaeon]